MSDTQRPLPLAGVRVLDLSRVLAGPWAGQLLADYGAEVIKVERPGAGDDTRDWGPPYTSAGHAAYFDSCNRGKRSIAVDITKPEGADLIRRIAGESDIVLENFKTGGLAKYGLDYEGLKAINPKLVYCSITGFGQTGPLAERPGYDYIIQAMGGMMSITGKPDEEPGGEPMRVGVAVADLFTGMYAATAVLASLRQAEATGEGRHIDLALLDTMLAVLGNQATGYFATDKSPGRIGNAHPYIVPYQVFPTADGHIVIAVGNDGQFKTYAAAIGAPELSADERFAKNGRRVENRDVLVPMLTDLMRAKTTSEWATIFEDAGVPHGPINDVGDALYQPQAQARGAVITHDDGRRTVAPPVRFGPTEHFTAPPTVGQHTDEVLKSVGLSADDVAALKNKGILQ